VRGEGDAESFRTFAGRSNESDRGATDSQGGRPARRMQPSRVARAALLAALANLARTAKFAAARPSWRPFRACLYRKHASQKSSAC